MLEEIPFLQDVRDGVNQRLNDPWRHCVSGSLSRSQLDDFSKPALEILHRGKRFRAIGAYIGWVAVAPLDSPQFPDELLDLGASLELFQASALVHDDIIDDAMYRRGLPAAHIAYTTSAPSGGPGFGRAASILWGDLLSAAANSYFANAIYALDSDASQRISRLYVSMQSEVAYGKIRIRSRRK